MRNMQMEDHDKAQGEEAIQGCCGQRGTGRKKKMRNDFI